MPNFQIAKMAKLMMLASTLGLGAFSFNAQAKLTSITTTDGTELVYSALSDVTWTKDANLLGTWFRSSTDADGNGTTDIIDEIIQATYNAVPSYLLPILKPQIDQYVNAAAFNDIGTATWYGANAYVTYLNSINYGGSNQWYLPTVANTSPGTNTATNGTAKGDELVELFYRELGGVAFGAIPNTAIFNNELTGTYWSGTEYALGTGLTWVFGTGDGIQIDRGQDNLFYAWAVTPGQIAAVPEADSLAMLLAGLMLVSVIACNRNPI